MRAHLGNHRGLVMLLLFSYSLRRSTCSLLSHTVLLLTGNILKVSWTNIKSLLSASRSSHVWSKVSWKEPKAPGFSVCKKYYCMRVRVPSTYKNPTLLSLDMTLNTDIGKKGHTTITLFVFDIQILLSICIKCTILRWLKLNWFQFLLHLMILLEFFELCSGQDWILSK